MTMHAIIINIYTELLLDVGTITYHETNNNGKSKYKLVYPQRY